jgi:hypothetical protein
LSGLAGLQARAIRRIAGMMKKDKNIAENNLILDIMYVFGLISTIYSDIKTTTTLYLVFMMPEFSRS